ncbi:MAG: hypothetical protein DRG59_03020 [Deltaproteobacteria bacterium]|nr:MAG: hypothetical protein DRG83_07775 [Deltaproteobacteria bacterium]RLB09210.1 MAG: hypothetical protein DRG59_03020 [Deltaproteobacteria bacterium]
MEVTQNDTEIILKLESDLTGDTVEELRIELLKSLEEQGSRVAVDLQKVENIDSMGLAVLIAAKKTSKQKHIILTLTNINEDIHNLFQLVHLAGFFDLN